MISRDASRERDGAHAGRGLRARVAAPAKLNLSLRVTGRRADGYHLLDSVVIPVGIADEVAVVVWPGRPSAVSVQSSPHGAAPDDATNLSARAARLFLERTGRRAAVEITLRKEIPAGAGMGGGSSDAAATLRLLNALAGAPVPASELARWALELGADVPLFLTGGPVRMRGIGELVEPLSLPNLAGAGFVVVFPGVGLETRHVYAKYDDSLTTAGPASRVRRFIVDRGPLHEWMENDLEAAAIQILPVLKDLKQQLGALGARRALMTGSGSAVFGVWQGAEEATAAARAFGARGMWARAASMLDALPVVEASDSDDDGRSPSW